MKVAALVEKMQPDFEKVGAQAVKAVGHVYHLEVAPAKGKPATLWTLDFKNGIGSAKEGKIGKADATFTLLDNDAYDIFTGKVNPQQAFMQGKLKIKGNLQAALKFVNPIIFPRPGL